MATGVPIVVECYAGSRGGEEPRALVMDGVRWRVLGINDRWRDPNADYFKVRADDGHLHLVRHDLETDRWTLVKTFESDA